MIARGDLLKIPTSSKTGDLYGGQLINKNVTISEKQGINGVREDLPKKQGRPPPKKQGSNGVTTKSLVPC